MKQILLIIILVLISFTTTSQNYTIPLWEGSPPNYKDTREKEIVKKEDGITLVSYVQDPDITVFLPSPKIATGKAVIICPGGGYWLLAYNIEGTDVAKYFITRGIAAIVLKYRLPVSKSNIEPHKSPLLDAKRAMRIVRYNAKKWNINPNQIGIMGFSAGGHLASTLSTHFDFGNPKSKDIINQQSSRPDFSILVYPVISNNEKISNKNLFNTLFGTENYTEKLFKSYSNELMVNNNTPPAILIHSSDDKEISPLNSIVYYEALQKRGITSELHIYPYGGHGFGLAVNKGYLSGWAEQSINFINNLFDKKEKN